MEYFTALHVFYDPMIVFVMIIATMVLTAGFKFLFPILAPFMLFGIVANVMLFVGSVIEYVAILGGSDQMQTFAAYGVMTLVACWVLYLVWLYANRRYI